MKELESALQEAARVHGYEVRGAGIPTTDGALFRVVPLPAQEQQKPPAERPTREQLLAAVERAILRTAEHAGRTGGADEVRALCEARTMLQQS